MKSALNSICEAADFLPAQGRKGFDAMVEDLVAKIKASTDSAKQFAAEKEAAKKQLEEEHKLGAELAVARELPPPALIADEPMNVRIQEARFASTTKCSSKFPEESGLEAGLVFTGDSGSKMVIIGYAPSNPSFGCLSVSFNVLKNTAISIKKEYIKPYRTDFVLKQLSPKGLERVKRKRMNKHMNKFDVMPTWTTDGFFIELDKVYLKAVVCDIVPTQQQRPIQIKVLETGRFYWYPIKLFHSKVVPLSRFYVMNPLTSASTASASSSSSPIESTDKSQVDKAEPDDSTESVSPPAKKQKVAASKDSDDSDDDDSDDDDDDSD